VKLERRRQPKSGDPSHETALAQHDDTLLNAVTQAAADLLRGVALDRALEHALAALGRVMTVDRILVLENLRGSDGRLGPVLRQAWYAPGVDHWLAPGPVASPAGRPAEIARLAMGEVVAARRTDASPQMQAFLAEMQIASMLLTPIRVDGRHWGQIAFDDCRTERSWTAAETAILQNLAELIGAAIRQERFVESLEKHDRLLDTVTQSAAIMSMAASTEEAIPRCLGLINEVIHLDRMLVMERDPSGPRASVLRYAWYAPGVQAHIRPGDIFTLDSLPPELAEIHQGRPAAAVRSQASPTMAAFMDQLGITSLLITPIMVDGRFWGTIAFDDCLAERIWTAAEIAVLQTLSELVGASINRERYERELADANMIVQNSPTVLYRLNGEPSFPLLYISQNISTYGHDPAEMVRRPRLYQDLIHPEDRSAVIATLAKLLEPDKAASATEFRLRGADGVYHWIDCHAAPIRDSAGRLMEVEGVLTDITERKAADEKIAHLARTDPLTGLANRATFFDQLRHAVANARRGAMGIAVLYLDLDRFKEINDTYGHPTGDELLRQAAQRLKERIRESDVAARLGGDEFAVLQTNVNDVADAGALAEKIRSTLTEPYLIDGRELRVGASVGISPFGPEVESADAMLVRADLALYRAKQEGRGRCAYHSEDLDRSVHERAALAQEFRSALQEGQIELHYRPQIEFLTGRIAGLEAHPHWVHPERGDLGLEAFAEAVENSGLTPDFGRWMLDTVCRQMAGWKTDGATAPVVAVNLSPLHLRGGEDVVEDVRGALAKWEVNPGQLELGVTEATLARITLAQSRVLEKLRALGVRIAIQEFGAQYSSLDYLKTYEVSRLKIGPDTVAAAGADSAMVRAIVSLARELGVEVVADGANTDDASKAPAGLPQPR
jgi:diguanylate cyclase (GGDEF)-like protein/PAS domain S-box-containing protein